MSKKKYTGFLGDLSESQAKFLQKFKESIKDDLVKPTNKLERDKQDVNCLRYCRASRFNLEKTMEFWENEKTWRAETKPHKLKIPDFVEEVKLNKMYISGEDKTGRPVLIIHAGKFMPSKTTQPIEHLIWVIERTIKSMEHPVDNNFVILDVKDFGWSNFDKVTMKKMSQIMMNYYVERLGKLFFVNASFLTKMIWGVAKVWIDKDTKAKITFEGGNFYNTLIKYVDPKFIPKKLGGEYEVPNWKKLLKEEEMEDEMQEKKEKEASFEKEEDDDDDDDDDEFEKEKNMSTIKKKNY
ncbi:cral-trio domain-containing protein [Anaeramoeba flamelloides]|uniref:Cral-trio domain-containing protein n=1 Tax=Anaeramoeba flamelloides TaxID=1746091 RepID=A0ABQ8YPP4_9EUKA|nr:cral-trio domain-containing protein [Anaeramoeba flamelloides]